MSKSNQNSKTQKLNPSCIVGMSLDSMDVELTQKIDIDYNNVIDKNKIILTSALEDNREIPTESLIGKSLFSRKRITEDYVKSSTIVSVIGEVPPLKDKLELNDIHNNYELKNKFAEGVQGIIRSAFDKSLKRNIVVKSLKVDEDEENAHQDESFFVSEARIMAQLDHPSIIPLYGLHSGTESKLHLAMKHIHGKTLKQYLADIVSLYKRDGIEKFDEERSIATRIEYLIKVCEAIDYAHCKGVVHRDLKPENIMIGNYGEAYVMDWGLACLVKPEKFSGDEIGAHEKNELVGTPCYIAPELIKGESCSSQSDVFSLGMILFEIVTLQRAVDGKTIKDVLKNIINQHYNPFKHRFPQKKLSQDLESIIDKAIADPLSHRYKSAKDMAKDLRLYLMNKETSARPDNVFRRYMRVMINHKLITSFVVVLIILGFATSNTYSLYRQYALIIEQKTREDMLIAFQANVSQNTNKMERIFFYFKTQLKNTAYRASRVLSSKVHDSQKIYENKDFLNKNTAPVDYSYAPAYDIKISLDHALLKLGPGTVLADKLNKRVVDLQARFKYAMFTSSPDFEQKTQSSIKKIIINQGAPLIWVYIGLKNGSLLSFPGSPYGDNYDPRKRPWFKSAFQHKEKLIWSEPYLDSSGINIVISCMQCVFDGNNNFLGVMAMDISFDYIQKSLFGRQLLKDAKEYLIDKKGRVIISSDFKMENAKSTKKATMALKKFPFLKQLRKAISEDMAQFEVISDEKKYIFGFNRLPSLDYYYIQQICEPKLIENWESNSSDKN